MQYKSAMKFIESSDRVKITGLDSADIRILNATQKHGKLSKTKLAEIVDSSPTPCWARLRKLKAAGFIRGHRSEIALDRIIDLTQVKSKPPDLVKLISETDK